MFRETLSRKLVEKGVIIEDYFRLRLKRGPREGWSAGFASLCPLKHRLPEQIIESNLALNNTAVFALLHPICRYHRGLDRLFAICHSSECV